MKPVLCLTAALLLAGCAHDGAKPEATPAAPPVKPAGMFEIMSTPEVATFFAANSVALYQGKPQLRQFNLVHNYGKPEQIGAGKTYVRSSSALRVINCERDETAQFGRVYFTDYFASGEEIARRDETPQWEPLQRQSILGELRNLVCAIDAKRLRAAGH